ncbi:inorganic diphosphatase [Meiothermus granaticius]|uniref:Inorganic pyrophosphatase n=1 Tax=Meiothermus granaticius NBRC 107808 TaxID=1227551 RepID=A0A399FDD6_9DEIN|nr:inorganic diphosphatase [Meiothermus granaticius]MCL6526296.1 inorganic diphosphatase [Thermaceae bacterium]RIH93429.1 Inorganic pyrophosphatase [Meiothermus granaticius NBRC 107808]GEM87677.1 inorganic pyrophosphatase [Meiothermus granaticius NBRC 107808]
MANLKHLPAGPNVPEVVNMVIEIPRGSGNKYEYHPELEVIKLDRVLPAPQFYPGDYGFIPSTLAVDGDPLDGLILSTYPFVPGVMVEVRVLGMMDMQDEKGDDAKIIGVVAEDPRFDHLQDISDVPQAIKNEIQHFFEHYKTLEAHKGKWVKVTGWEGKAAAHAEIQACVERYKQK